MYVLLFKASVGAILKNRFSSLEVRLEGQGGLEGILSTPKNHIVASVSA